MAERRKKTHMEARRSHLALQARRQALARMRAGEVVDIRLARDASGQLVRARSFDEAHDDPAGMMVLVILRKRLRAEWCSDKDGLRVGRRRLDYKDILGVVLQVDGKSPYEGEGSYWAALRERVERKTEMREG